MMKTVLKISGMSCQNCVRHVKEALEELDGVTAVSVQLENNTAEIEHTEGITAESMAAAVEDAGYDVV